jgi:hypothetical protein
LDENGWALSGLGFVKLDFLIGKKWWSNAGRKQSIHSTRPEKRGEVEGGTTQYQPVNTKTKKIPSSQSPAKIFIFKRNKGELEARKNARHSRESRAPQSQLQGQRARAPAPNLTDFLFT